MFLPTVLAGFFLIGGKLGKSYALGWLVLASLVFYASWEPGYTWLLLGSIIFNYLMAKAMAVYQRHKKTILFTSIVANVSLLAYYKVLIAGLFDPTRSFSAAFSTTGDLLIPLGISFITFQQIAFLVDSYKQRLGDKPFLEYCLFITFFPQLIMGPIVHYREIAPQLNRPSFPRWNSSNFAIGLAIFSIGLFKKVVLGDGIADYVDKVHLLAQSGVSINLIDAWASSIGFTFQIYFDFSGYADMAIGLARMLNLKLPINFDSPYKAINRFDMWRRWHISFGAFIRQYVYFPLARAKHLKLGTSGALLVTVLLSGFWHGLGWTFVLWSMAQGVIMLMIHHRQKSAEFRFNRTIAIAATFITTTILGVLFRSVDLAVAGNIYLGMLGQHALGLPVPVAQAYEALIGTPLPPELIGHHWIRRSDIPLLIIMAIIIWILPNTQRLFRDYWTAIDQRMNKPALTALDRSPLISRIKFTPNPTWALFIAAILVAGLLFLDRGSRFIYYQF
ncbi:MAG: MBOAT family O-acyltransferase [bacterium]